MSFATHYLRIHLSEVEHYFLIPTFHMGLLILMLPIAFNFQIYGFTDEIYNIIAFGLGGWLALRPLNARACQTYSGNQTLTQRRVFCLLGNIVTLGILLGALILISNPDLTNSLIFPLFLLFWVIKAIKKVFQKKD